MLQTWPVTQLASVVHCTQTLKLQTPKPAMCAQSLLLTQPRHWPAEQRELPGSVQLALLTTH